MLPIDIIQTVYGYVCMPFFYQTTKLFFMKVPTGYIMIRTKCPVSDLFS